MNITRKVVVERLKNAKSPLADKAPIVADITHLINRYHDEDKRPLYVYCTVTGRKVGMTAKAYFAKRIKEYGSIENLLLTYRGRALGGARPMTHKIGVRGKVSKGIMTIAHNGPQISSSQELIKTNKDGSCVFRETIKHDKKIVVVRDFDEKTEAHKYIKGKETTVNDIFKADKVKYKPRPK